MSSTLILTTVILENQTGSYSFDIVNELGEGIDKSELDNFTLTYYDRETQEIINTRDGQDVFDVNDVTITTVTTPILKTTVYWAIQPEDSVVIDDRREIEQHIALFQWSWGGSVFHAAHEIQFGIENLLFVP